ncbi:LPPG:FO 2-phospho-L-lactate transferase [Caulobacter ginsengisoli]|uniref:LPPG:FO 2-phospho-L-lactate transferase n=1 Tax=Caulobacter ginsengisoli TaxID=400775 RepID=A0ABU0IY34_9CAUL|nr:2-phospho-L-lactate transferase [Caulobacter ginsengisoli]MDQ0466915.1 LPPG:FO 2-phospho-L-lactate transferase [Caulobacter ginsengisoli]
MSVLALCGGVGGAKLAFGLAAEAADLTIAVNTGDDFEHLGLTVCPDIDTVLYTLSDLADRERGWGLAGETWGFMAALARLGGETWFQLGDHDLATHVERTRRLAAGDSLSAVTAHLARALGLKPGIVPMSDQPVRTHLLTDTGELAFQPYFVRERCAPVVRRVRYQGAATAAPSPGFAAALARPDLTAIVICPSNPYLSIDPILAVPGVREALQHAAAPIVAVSPIVAGQALKGPAAKLMAELGVEPGVEAVARHYAGLIDGLVVDTADAGAVPTIEALGVRALAVPSVMRSDDDRRRLARDALAFAATLSQSRARAG